MEQFSINGGFECASRFKQDPRLKMVAQGFLIPKHKIGTWECYMTKTWTFIWERKEDVKHASDESCPPGEEDGCVKVNSLSSLAYIGWMVNKPIEAQCCVANAKRKMSTETL